MGGIVFCSMCSCIVEMSRLEEGIGCCVSCNKCNWGRLVGKEGGWVCKHGLGYKEYSGLGLRRFGGFGSFVKFYIRDRK